MGLSRRLGDGSPTASARVEHSPRELSGGESSPLSPRRSPQKLSSLCFSLRRYDSFWGPAKRSFTLLRINSFLAGFPRRSAESQMDLFFRAEAEEQALRQDC